MVTKSNKSRWLTWVRKAKKPFENHLTIVWEPSGTSTRAAGRHPKPSKSGLCDQRVLVVRIAEVHQFGVSASDIETTAETTAMADLTR
jgi:hypothetical protein